MLRLSNAERRHLYVLAGLNPPAPEPAAEHGCEGLLRLIDAWMPYPAHIMDAYYNCVLYNEAAGWVLGMRPENRLLCVESTAMRVPARPDLTVVLHTPWTRHTPRPNWSGWPHRRGDEGRGVRLRGEVSGSGVPGPGRRTRGSR